MTGFALEAWRRQAVCPERQAEQCRTGVALFDFSFMSVVRVPGPDAASLISSYARRDISGMAARAKVRLATICALQRTSRP